MRPNSQQTSAFFCPFVLSHITLTFSSMLKTLLLFMTSHVTMLPVSC